MRPLLARRRGIDDEDDGWEERLFNEGAGFELDDADEEEDADDLDLDEDSEDEGLEEEDEEEDLDDL